MIAVQAPASIPSPFAVPSNAPEHCPVRTCTPNLTRKVGIDNFHRVLTLTEQANLMPAMDAPIKLYAPLG